MSNYDYILDNKKGTTIGDLLTLSNCIQSEMRKSKIYRSFYVDARKPIKIFGYFEGISPENHFVLKATTKHQLWLLMLSYLRAIEESKP